MDINLSDSEHLDAVVSALSVTIKQSIRYIDDNKSQAANHKILRGTLTHDTDALIEKHGDLDKLADAMIEGDPEIDIETYGSFLTETSRVYINPEGEMVHRVQHTEIVRDPDGNEKERRPRKINEGNTSTEIPLSWTEKTMPKKAALTRVVFSRHLQITHNNGLTYKFLYNMAKELADKDVLMMIAGGPKGNEPLVFRRHGSPYRGFLEGRIDGDKYMLILHLSNMELKTPKPNEDKEAKKDSKAPAESEVKPKTESKPKSKAKPKTKAKAKATTKKTASKKTKKEDSA